MGEEGLGGQVVGFVRTDLSRGEGRGAGSRVWEVGCKAGVLESW